MFHLPIHGMSITGRCDDGNQEKNHLHFMLELDDSVYVTGVLTPRGHWIVDVLKSVQTTNTISSFMKNRGNRAASDLFDLFSEYEGDDDESDLSNLSTGFYL